jgi:basic membrane protein A
MKTFVRGLIAVLVVMSIILSVACGKIGKKPGGSESVDPVDPNRSESPTSGSAKIGEGRKIAYITPPSGLGDGAIGDAIYYGLLEAKELFGFDLDYSEPMSPTDYEEMIAEYAGSGDYDLIFLGGADGLDPITAVGPDYPDQKCVLYDVASAGNDQYVSEYFAKNEIGFIAGVLAALIDAEGEVVISGVRTTFEPSGKIGLVMGVEVPATVPALTGAAAGIKYVKPEAEYLYAIVGNWSDQAKNKEIGLSMIDQGANVIFANAGGGGLGLIAAGKERNSFFIGYDTDQTHWDPERVVGSSMKQNTATILRVLTEYFETGELAWGTAEENNASNGGIGFTYNPDFEVPENIASIVEQVIQDLKSGKISAPNTWEEVEAFDAVFAGQ